MIKIQTLVTAGADKVFHNQLAVAFANLAPARPALVGNACTHT